MNTLYFAVIDEVGFIDHAGYSQEDVIDLFEQLTPPNRQFKLTTVLYDRFRHHFDFDLDAFVEMT